VHLNNSIASLISAPFFRAIGGGFGFGGTRP